jgi:hypothetical protein
MPKEEKKRNAGTTDSNFGRKHQIGQKIGGGGGMESLMNELKNK